MRLIYLRLLASGALIAVMLVSVSVHAGVARADSADAPARAGVGEASDASGVSSATPHRGLEPLQDRRR